MADETNVGTGQPGEVTGIAGTNFKSPEELAAAYQSLEKKLGEQGNELGQARKDHTTAKGQVDMLTKLLNENMGKGNADTTAATKPTVDYDGQMNEVKKQLSELDPMSEGFGKTQTKLITKLTSLAQAKQHEITLTAATSSASELLKKELSDRDAKAAKEAFLTQNPTFQTPEMQARIQDFMANDRTGMHDPMSAFFQIQRDDLAVKADQISKENEEMKKVLDLSKGKTVADQAKVVVKGQTTTGQQTNQPKVTGKARDEGMAQILANLRGA